MISEVIDISEVVFVLPVKRFRSIDVGITLV
jgi:hypothetical protein